MAFNVVDEVTADCLESGDLIFIEVGEERESVYFVIDEVVDKFDSIFVYGYSLNQDDDTFEVSFDPEQKISLYMESDDE